MTLKAANQARLQKLLSKGIRVSGVATTWEGIIRKKLSLGYVPELLDEYVEKSMERKQTYSLAKDSEYYFKIPKLLYFWVIDLLFFTE